MARRTNTELDSFYAVTDRTETNRFYQLLALKLVSDNAAAIPNIDRFKKAKSCMEQIGRMIDTIDDTAIIKQAKIAADALSTGCTVKQAEAYLRHGRTTGEWNESLLTATREAASNTTKPIKGLTPADLIAIESLLRDNMTLYDIPGEANRENKPRERRNARMAEMYADKIKVAYEAMTGHTFPQITGDKAQ